MTQATPSHNWFPEPRAIRGLFSAKAYVVAYPFLAVTVGIFYALLLPGLPLGTLAPWVLQFLKPSEIVFAMLMGLLLPLVLLLNLFLWRHPSCALTTRARHNGPLASILVGVVPNALCCTPVIPTMVGLLASGATLIAISAPIQYFFNTYAWLLYALATLGVWFSLREATLRFATARDT